MILETELPNSDATESFAKSLAKVLLGNETIELVADLGGGKTTFVRGLVSGLGGDESAVSSPTFTIEQRYQTPRTEVVHCDFYRLTDPGVMKDELREAIDDPTTLVAVEWAEIVLGVLPVAHFRVLLQQGGGDFRSLSLEWPEELITTVEQRDFLTRHKAFRKDVKSL